MLSCGFSGDLAAEMGVPNLGWRFGLLDLAPSLSTCVPMKSEKRWGCLVWQKLLSKRLITFIPEMSAVHIDPSTLLSAVRKVLHVGPSTLLSPPPSNSDENDCLLWLEKQKPSSVAYISFGSMMTPLPNESLKVPFLQQ